MIVSRRSVHTCIATESTNCLVGTVLTCSVDVPGKLERQLERAARTSVGHAVVWRAGGRADQSVSLGGAGLSGRAGCLAAWVPRRQVGVPVVATCCFVLQQRASASNKDSFAIVAREASNVSDFLRNLEPERELARPASHFAS